MNKYRVQCTNCNNTEEIIVDKDNTVFWGKMPTYIVSARYRLDMNWGFQCICGNNDIITKQEQKEIANLQAPDPVDISRVLKSIIPDKPRFKMFPVSS